MKLSEHFTLEEMIASSEAPRRGIDNSPTPDVIEELRKTAELLEEVRAILGGQVVIVTSGYRCPALNAAIGGAANSAHMWGGAADFLCPSAGSPMIVCQKLAGTPGLRFDQIIHEFGSWTHIGRARDGSCRQQVLTIDGSGTRFGL